MFLPDLFAASLAGQRDDVALEYDAPGAPRPASVTFGELDVRSDRVAAWLTARGVGRGDRVGIYLPNRVEFIDLFLASLKLGAIFVPMNVLYREREVSHIVSDATPRVVVASSEGAALMPAGTAVALVDEVARAAGDPAFAFEAPRLEGSTPAALVYTSGTTGRSKGAVLSHDNFASNVANIVACWRITSRDRYLGVLPLFHVHGLGNGVCAWLASGCRMRLAERFDAARAASLFEDFRPTLVFGVPTIYVRLLELPEDVARGVGGRVRLFVCGSAPLPAHVLEAFRARFGHTILERYGMSETLMITGNPYGGERRAGTVGVPFPGVAVRIVDESGNPVADGTVGQLEVRGPNVCASYWANEAATAAAFRDGWFRTGDLAERSADGYYTLRGRGTDLIISGGFNIYPREIEELLLEQPGVREVAVASVPDARRGEVPVAYVVSDATVDDEALRDVCLRSLASFKVPRAFVRVEALPRTALGKVQKHLLPPWGGEPA
jgi:malonyl-CoA/methylmalonyl-CoA synthetase